jgi:phospholipid transport system substrate-binding protein
MHAAFYHVRCPRRRAVLASYAFAASVLVVVPFAGILLASEEKLETPTEAVRMVLTDVFRILDEPSLKAVSKQSERRRLLEEAIARRFEYREMSKRALASHWTPLTDAEREEFVELFKGFLSDRYAGKIEGYSGERVHYLGERREGQFAEVRTKLVSNKVEIPMDYRLVNQHGRWYAYDIIADGVSLVKNYRSQFDKIIGSESYEELTKRLRNRTVTEEAKKKRD